MTWAFCSVDPASGALPDEVFAGFLPVNDSSHRGEGSVSFLVRPRPDVQTGETLDAQASIVFDTNAPLSTNIFTNTIDKISTGAASSRCRILSIGRSSRSTGLAVMG